MIAEDLTTSTIGWEIDELDTFIEFLEANDNNENISYERFLLVNRSSRRTVDDVQSLVCRCLNLKRLSHLSADEKERLKKISDIIKRKKYIVRNRLIYKFPLISISKLPLYFPLFFFIFLIVGEKAKRNFSSTGIGRISPKRKIYRNFLR